MPHIRYEVVKTSDQDELTTLLPPVLSMYRSEETPGVEQMLVDKIKEIITEFWKEWVHLPHPEFSCRDSQQCVHLHLSDMDSKYYQHLQTEDEQRRNFPDLTGKAFIIIGTELPKHRRSLCLRAFTSASLHQQHLHPLHPLQRRLLPTTKPRTSLESAGWLCLHAHHACGRAFLCTVCRCICRIDSSAPRAACYFVIISFMWMQSQTRGAEAGEFLVRRRPSEISEIL